MSRRRFGILAAVTAVGFLPRIEVPTQELPPMRLVDGIYTYATEADPISSDNDYAAFVAHLNQEFKAGRSPETGAPAEMRQGPYYGTLILYARDAVGIQEGTGMTPQAFYANEIKEFNLKLAPEFPFVIRRAVWLDPSVWVERSVHTGYLSGAPVLADSDGLDGAWYSKVGYYPPGSSYYIKPVDWGDGHEKEHVWTHLPDRFAVGFWIPSPQNLALYLQRAVLEPLGKIPPWVTRG